MKYLPMILAFALPIVGIIFVSIVNMRNRTGLGK